MDQFSLFRNFRELITPEKLLRLTEPKNTIYFGKISISQIIGGHLCREFQITNKNSTEPETK